MDSESILCKQYNTDVCTVLLREKKKITKEKNMNYSKQTEINTVKPKSVFFSTLHISIYIYIV